MKYKNYLIGGMCVATLVLCLTLTAQTMPKKSSSLSASVTPNGSASPNATASPGKQATRPLPFHGMVSAVDQKAKTFRISGKETSRVFKVTDKTVVTKGGNAAAMKDIKENEEISGSYWKKADGTFEAKTVKVGPMEKAKVPTASPAASTKTSPSPEPSASPKP